MPIRVEHGPNLAAVGQLAYRTGQLEYRNKRRTELERIAMLQAQMRQKAQQQQQQIAATLQGQKMSHMGAMQRLQQAQQFGQINAEQANQWKVQADIQKQQNQVIWGKQLGQNQLDLANMNAGIADQKAIKNIQNTHRQEQAFQNLNPAGEGEWLNIGKQIVAAGLNKKIPPQELEGHIAQLRAQQDALQDQDEFTYGKDTKVGTQSVHIKDEDGNPTVYKTVTVRNEDGSVVYGYTPATTQMVEGPNGNMTLAPLTAQQIHDNTTTTVKRGGRDYLAKLNSTNGVYEIDDNARPIETAEWKAQEAANDRAEAEDKRHEKWYIDREHERQELKAGLEAKAAETFDTLTPEQVALLEPAAYHAARPVPIVPVREVAPVAPVAPPAQQDQVIPLDDAAQVAPVDDFAQQQQQQQQDQQQQRDPTQAIGNQGNPRHDPVNTPIGQYFQTADMPQPMLKQAAQEPFSNPAPRSAGDGSLGLGDTERARLEKMFAAVKSVPAFAGSDENYDPANANQVAGGLAVYEGAEATSLTGEVGYRTQKAYNNDAREAEGIRR